MDITLNIIILDRSSAPPTASGGLRTKKIMRSFEWRINMDAIAAATSRFRVVENIRNNSEIVAGDIVIVTQAAGMFGNNMADAPPAPPGGQWTHALYFGVVDTYTEDVLTCRDISSLFNVINLITSNTQAEAGNPDLYIMRLMQEVQQTPGIQLGFVDFRRGANINRPWSRTIERPTTQNISQVISDIFTYNQFIATAHYFWFNGTANPPTTRIEMFIRHEGDASPIQLNLSDASTFYDVDVFVQDRNIGSPNLLRVWNDDGQVQPTWARLQNGNVVSFTGTPAANIMNQLDMPVVMGGITARIDSEHPFNEARAREHLTGNEYRHTITFRYNVQEALGNRLLRVGRFVRLIYDQQTFDSIITAWAIDSETSLATVTCGNIRSSLQSFIGY